MTRKAHHFQHLKFRLNFDTRLPILGQRHISELAMQYYGGLVAWIKT